MPGGDTAVLDVDNGVEPEESLEAFYEAPLEEPEEAAEAVADETTETEESPFAGRALEEVAADPVVAKLIADREARLNESYRQRVENEQRKAQAEAEQRAFEYRASQAQEVRQGLAHKALTSIVRNALEKGEEVTDAHITPVARALANAVFHDQFEAISGFQRELVLTDVPDYRASPQTLAMVEQARRTNNPQALAQANYHMQKEALWAGLWPHALQAAAQALQDQGKVEGVKKAAATRSATPRPTVGGATGGRQKTYTLDEIENMPVREWDALPDAERARILATAR